MDRLAPTWTDEQIARGRELAETADRCPWEMGDLALAAVPIGQRNVNDGSLTELKEFARQIGVEPSTLRRQREVARQWPDALRSASATWTAHKHLSGPVSDAPYRKAILEELSAGKEPGRRVTADDVRKYLGGSSSRAPGDVAIDLALDVLDRITKLHAQLDRAERKRDGKPWPAQKVRARYAARLADAELLVERIRAIAGDAIEG